MMDRTRKAALIQIYNPDKEVHPLELLFECEIYINFSDTISKLKTDHAHVVSFVFHNRYFGLEFPNEAQSKFFVNAVKSIEDT